MRLTSDPLGAPGHDRPGQVARGLFVEVGKHYLNQVDLVSRELQHGPVVKREDLLAAVGNVRSVWEARPESAEKSLALGRLAQDEQWMTSVSQPDLKGLAGQLKSDCDERVKRLEWTMIGCLALAAGGGLACLAPGLLDVSVPYLVPAGGVVLLGGILGTGAAASLRDRPPQLGTLGRLYVYADAASAHQEVHRLADSLGGKNPSAVALSERGVSVGGVFLPSRRGPAPSSA